MWLLIAKSPEYCGYNLHLCLFKVLPQVGHETMRFPIRFLDYYMRFIYKIQYYFQLVHIYG